MNTYSPSRRTFMAAAALLAGLSEGALAQSNAPPATAATQLRIGYQKTGVLFALKARGTLDKRLAEQGITVQWTDFPAGPQLLEGMNVGAIDFGATGEPPVIFALAAGTPLVYVVNQQPSPRTEAIIVPRDSPIKRAEQLRGQRIAVARGSSAHYTLVRVLEQAGIPYSDIQPIYLVPADARAAFVRGSIDAWGIWDPYYAAAQEQLGARTLIDATGLKRNSSYFLASRSYALARPDVLDVVVDELKKTAAWAVANPKALADILLASLNLEPDVINRWVARQTYGVQQVDADALAELQRIADTFYALKLIPRPVKATDALLDAPNKRAPG